MWPSPVAAENTVGIAVISLVFIVGGYLLLAALWYLMVYRPSRRDRMERQTSARDTPPDAMTGAHTPGDDGPDRD